jgi:protein-tyrosine phosphatase
LSRIRVLAWEGCFNVRDLGGLPTADGRRTRNGALVRSDTLCRLTPAGQTALVAHGVHTVIDLRWPAELERDEVPHPFRACDGVVYLNIPVTTGRDEAELIATAPIFGRPGLTRAELNVLEVDHNPRGIARICTEVARAPDGGVLLHCHAGKDRTGVVVAVILALLGVPDELIAEDYAMSAANLAALTHEWLDRSSQDPAERARLMRQAEPSPAAIQALLDRLRERYGGAEPYLLGGGMTPAHVAALRARLLD